MVTDAASSGCNAASNPAPTARSECNPHLGGEKSPAAHAEPRTENMLRTGRGGTRRVLVTGPSGSGKSTLARFFRERGENAVDAEDSRELRGLNRSVDLDGRPYRITQEQWRRAADWQHFWDGPTLERFLARHPNVFLFGASDNMFEYAHLFDRRIFLRVSWSVLRTRLSHPTRENDWGSEPGQRDWVRTRAREWPVKARKAGFEFVNAEVPPDRIFRQVCGPRDLTRREKAAEGRVDLLEHASPTDFFWEFARAEVRNDRRHHRMYRRGLGPTLFARVRSGDKVGLDRSERSRLRATVLSTRPEYLRPLLRLGLRWTYGRLPPRELPRLRVPNLDIFRPTAASRRLRDLAAALDRDAPTLWPPLAENYRRMQARFDSRRWVGTPIVVGTSPRGPFTIVEGLTRLSVLASRWQRGKPVPPGIRLLIGLGPTAGSWWCF